MILKHRRNVWLFTLVLVDTFSQINHLAFHRSYFVLKQKPNENLSANPQGNMLHFNGTYAGVSFQSPMKSSQNTVIIADLKNMDQDTFQIQYQTKQTWWF